MPLVRADIGPGVAIECGAGDVAREAQPHAA
ncbi:MAG: hypothetical protein QOC95_2082, partial [Thermoleophilaceae bacterium]|nr:hypothetical protein [Thermoleophilaceae bacterium]